MMSSRMKTFFSESGRFLAPLLILAVGIGGFVVFGQRPKVPQRAERPQKTMPVRTAVVERYEEALPLEVDGVVVPYRQIRLSAEVEGRVMQKEPGSRAGSYVRLNAPLLQIDPTDYRLQVERLRSELKQAEADLDAVETDIDNTQKLIALSREEWLLRQKDLRRTEKAFARKAVTEREMDEGRRMELSARNTLQTLLNQLAASRRRKAILTAARERANVQFRQAMADLRRTEVAAPVNGTIVKDYVEEGDFVKKGDPLFLINETNRMEVKCSLRIDQLFWIWMQQKKSRLSDSQSPREENVARRRFQLPQTPAEVVFRLNGVEYLWEGELSRYEGTGLDEKTRMVPCRVLVSAPAKVRVSGKGSRNTRGDILPPALFSGMYVSVRIPVQPSVPLLSIPAVALRPGGKVWVVRRGRLCVEPVEVVHAAGERVILRPRPQGKLQAGEKVVISPLPQVDEGLAVAETGP